MDEPKEIVKSNIDRYNRKLVYHDGILVVSILFILINYFLIIEPNYRSTKELLFRTEKIQVRKNDIDKYKRSLISKIPNSVNINVSGSSYETMAEKLTPYLQQNQWDSVQSKLNDTKEAGLNFEMSNEKNIALWDSVQSKLNDIKDADQDIENLKQKNIVLKKNISESGDLLSLVKILLFINDGRTHFALFLSYVALIVLIYFYLTRTYLLNLLARTLRIQKEKIKLNEYFEYSLNYSIWLSPVPDKSAYSISKDELLNTLAIKNNHQWYKRIMAIAFIGIVALQLRLYFIELNIHTFNLGAGAILSFINCIATVFICFLWLSRNKIPDYLNSEQNKTNGFSRRDFLKLTAIVLPVSLFALSFPALKQAGYAAKSSRLYNWLFNNPRYVKNKKSSNATSEMLEIEKQCLDLISKKQYGACVSMLYPQVKKRIESKKWLMNEEAIRLSDLLVKTLLFATYRKQQPGLESTFSGLIHLCANSNNETLKRRSVQWSQPDYKWIGVCKKPQAIIKWNKTIFM